MSDETLTVYSYEDVAKHNSTSDLWVVYNGRVYDITSYVDEHPGGEEVVVDVAGTDATEAFDDIGHSDDAHEILKGLLIGKVEGAVLKEAKSITATQESGGVSLPLVAAVGFAVVAGAYFYLNQ